MAKAYPAYTGEPFAPTERLAARRVERDGNREAACIMAHVTYEVVEHDGGWAYKLGDVFSEAFANRAAALAAARRVAREQHVPGNSAYIEYQDEAGRWHTEFSAGSDRPDAEVDC